MNLFRLDTSIMPGTSTSAELANTAEAEWTAAHPEGTVTRRNLGTDPLPGDVWTAATLAAFTPEDQRTPEQQEAAALGASLAAELSAADAAIIAVPLYNWGVSQHFKTWVDLVARSNSFSRCRRLRRERCPHAPTCQPLMSSLRGCWSHRQRGSRAAPNSP